MSVCDRRGGHWPPEMGCLAARAVCMYAAKTASSPVAQQFVSSEQLGHALAPLEARGAGEHGEPEGIYQVNPPVSFADSPLYTRGPCSCANCHPPISAP